MLNRGDLHLPELDDVVVPKMHLVDVAFDDTRIDDIYSHILAQKDRVTEDLSGKKIALAVGSRGISDLAIIVSATVDLVRAFGGEPVIIPSMGSHGGATAEGQVAILAALGVTPGSVNAPIVGDMATRIVGTTDGGHSVSVAESALACAGVVLINRIKPHTGFKGEVESGLLKMAMIGLGKVSGATTAHKTPIGEFPERLKDYFAAFSQQVPILFGVGVVENAFDKALHAEVIAPGDIVAREKELLCIAKRNMPRLPLKAIDVLIVQEMGKEISGPGIDPNVTGRSNSRFFDPKLVEAPEIGKMVTLSLTKASKGNAAGLGINDVISKRLFDATDLAATYRNVITGGIFTGGRVPIVMPDDFDAVRLALLHYDPNTCRVAWIRNTLRLSRIAVSGPCLDQLPSWASPGDQPTELTFRDGVLEISNLL